MNPIGYAIDRINRKPKDKYNILTFPTHEGFQTLLDHTGHNFFLLNRPGHKEWNHSFKPVPPNHQEIGDTRPYTFDFILSQERFGQLQKSLEIQLFTRLPILHMEHVEPQLDRWIEEQFDELSKLHGDINVFITDHNRKSWRRENDGLVINHGIDTDLFSGWTGETANKPYVLYVVNQLAERDYFCGYEIWKEIRDRIQRELDVDFRLVGDNGPLGQVAQSDKHLVNSYRRCACYINTSQLSPVPMSLLEAMSVGCPIVTTAKQEIPNIVTPDCGVCSNNINELVDGVKKYITDKDAARSASEASKRVIEERFNLQTFVDNWNNAFDRVYNMSTGSACIEC
jgi:glycosyltransferase involved in cell wall biosynthesis